MSALGDEFRSAREARGLALSDVAEQIHIRSVYLNAIENEDWASIGAPVYVRGFIRTYARFLGLDGEAGVAAYNQTVPVEKPAPSSSSHADRERSGLSVWAIAGIAIALILAAFAGFQWFWYSHAASTGVAVQTQAAVPAASPNAAASAAPTPLASGSSTAAPAGLKHGLAIRLTQRSWLRVVVDGKTEIEGIFPAGTERTFTGNVADVRVGNAGGVSIAVDGRPPATLGKDGDVAEQHFAL